MRKWTDYSGTIKSVTGTLYTNYTVGNERLNVQIVTISSNGETLSDETDLTVGSSRLVLPHRETCGHRDVYQNDVLPTYCISCHSSVVCSCMVRLLCVCVFKVIPSSGSSSAGNGPVRSYSQRWHPFCWIQLFDYLLDVLKVMFVKRLMLNLT